MGEILVGDALATLRTLPAESVHCCVTSPPYWGLRDYGEPGQLGLEPTPEEYVQRLVGVFREVRRVLRGDGTLWLNLGDSYAATMKGTGGTDSSGLNAKRDTAGNLAADRKSQPTNKGYRLDIAASGLKPKDLVGIPWRVAFALQADGWYLRSDIVWAKPNPMPESVTDRPTKSHEYLFLLAKGQRTTRVVEGPYLRDKFVHFSDHGRLDSADFRGRQICIGLASAILDSAESDDNLGLSALDPQVRHQRGDGYDGVPVGDSPQMHGPAVLASRFLRSETSAEEFMGEVHRLFVALPDGDDLLKRWAPSVLADTPSVYRYGDGSVAINDAGKVSKFDLLHNEVSISRPSGCSYFYDADAVRESAIKGSANAGDRNYRAGTDGNQRKNCGQTEQQQGSGRNRRSVWTIATQPFNGWFETVRKVPVEADAGVDGIQRTASPDCPVHGSADRQGSTPPGGERVDDSSTRSPRSSESPAPSRPPDSASTPTTREPSRLAHSLDCGCHVCSPSATGHSSGSRKTDPAPVTSPPCSADARTTPRTGRTRESRESCEQPPRTPSSKNESAGMASSGDHGTSHHTARTRTQPGSCGASDPPVCTCSFYIEKRSKTSHFAIMPPALVRPCILAGTSARGVCPECGTPWVRVVERSQAPTVAPSEIDRYGTGDAGVHRRVGGQYQKWLNANPPQTTGWRPTCAHTADPVPATVLDPFAGAGTVPLVAAENGRDYLGIELNPEYAEMARERIRLRGRTPTADEVEPGQASLFPPPVDRRGRVG